MIRPLLSGAIRNDPLARDRAVVDERAYLEAAAETYQMSDSDFEF
jgi:hypothetical protein